MADKLFPWTEIVPDIPDDYIWDCVETTITELPNIVSWCYPGQFRSLARIQFGGEGLIFHSHLRTQFHSRPVIEFAVRSNTPTVRDFVSTSDVVFDLESGGLNRPLFFASTSNIQFVTFGKIHQIYHAETDIVTSITSDANVERELASIASITFDALSDSNTEHELTSQVNITTDIISDIIGDVEEGGGIDSFTVLMLHMDGNDDGTVFTDASDSNHIMAPVNNVVTKIAVKKFGSASALFDGFKDYIYTSDSADWNFGTGDFTIDLWFRPVSLAEYDTLIGQTNIDSGNLWKFDLGASGTHPRFTASEGSIILAEYIVTDAQTFTLDIWCHLAFVRNGSTYYFFKDGVYLPFTIATDLGSGSMPDLNSRLTIGTDDNNFTRDINSNVDELRVSKGIARWTANFTPKTGPYT